MALGDRRLGEPVTQVLGQVEAAAVGDQERVPNSLGELPEAPGLLLGGAEVELGVGAAEAVALLQRAAVPDRHQRVLEAVPEALVVVDVAGGDGAHADPPGELGQRPVPVAVAEDQVVLELDEDVLPAEPSDPVAEDGLGLGRPAALHQQRHRPLPAAGQADQAPAVAGQPGDGEAGVEAPLLPTLGVGLLDAVGEADQPAEVAVALPGLGEQGQVMALLAQVLDAGRVPGQGQLDAGDGLEPELGAEPGEDHGSEEIVVVGDGQAAVAELDRPLDQLLGMGGAVEERVVGVQVELGVAVQ